MEDPKKHAGKPHNTHSTAPGEEHFEPGKEKGKAEKVTISIKELEEMKSRLENSEKSCSQNLDGWQRERAEFSNYKKRIDREQDQLRQTITGSVIKKYLVVLDDLELALKSKPKSAEGASWAKGIELIARKIITIIESEGIERINENKVQFDPNVHEAISNEENPDFDSGEVIEVVRPGYKLGDRTLRPAMVRVAR